MTTPTRFIEEDTYQELLKLNGGYAVQMVLEALEFRPPTEGMPNPSGIIEPSVNIYQLNVAEPVIYRNPKDGTVWIIISPYDDYSFEYFADMHSGKNVWGYILAPRGWKAGGDMPIGHAEFFFADDVPDYDEQNVRTH